MSEFFFKCPHCGTNLLCDDSLNGSTTLCTNCNNEITPKTFTTLKQEREQREREQREREQQEREQREREQREREQREREQEQLKLQKLEPQTEHTAENCGWSNFLTVMGTLQMCCAVILFFIGISRQAPLQIFIGIGVAVSVAISSIPFFLLAWIVQQIYISNDLKRKQIELLTKISNKK